MSIAFNKGWNLIGIGDLGGADAVLKDPNGIIDSDLYYFDNINKSYLSISSETLAETNSSQSVAVKSFVLSKNVAYWCKVKNDADIVNLNLEYYYTVRSSVKTNSGDPFVVLNLSNTGSYPKTRLEAFISEIQQSVDILDTLFQPQQTDDSITLKTIDISLQTDETLDGSLGQASGGTIEINDQNSGTNGLGKKTGTGETLETLSQNIHVIIHEIMHVLGFGLGTKWDRLVKLDNPDNPDDKNYFFKGENAISAYKQLVDDDFGYSKIPIEDDGGTGTEYAHWEEDEIRTDSSGKIYPYFREEIMSGYLNGNNYISKLTLGAFHDMNYLVNYNSDYVTTPPVYTENYSDP